MDLLQDFDREPDAELIVHDFVDVGDAAAADQAPFYKTLGGRRDFARRGFTYGRNAHAEEKPIK